MGSKTVTTKTELPPMSPEEASMMNLGINYLLAGPLNDKFYVKQVDKVRYKNQGLMDTLSSEKERLTRELTQLEETMKRYQGGVPGSPQYAEKSIKLREVESRIGQVNARLSKIGSDMEKGAEDSTPYTDYQLLDKPPPQFQKTLMALDEQTRSRAEDILSNYGYSSKEFRAFAKSVKAPGVA